MLILEYIKHKQVYYFQVIAYCLFLSFFNILQAQDSTTIYKKRFKTLIYTSSITYTVGMTGLASVWYKENWGNEFTFFNDNHEWRGIDKFGHFYTSFHISNTAVHLLKWSGVSSKKAIWYGGMSGAVLMAPIEIFDGFSKEYGASWGDLVANTAGSILVTSQYLLWNEIRIIPKFSYHFTGYAHERPNTLGSSPSERLIKDYNGHTYWLSFNIASLSHSKTIPQWLNVSLGYGANNMLYADEKVNTMMGYNSYSRFFLSLDLDLTRIKTKSKFLNSLLYSFNILHCPLPALEYNNQQGFIFHPIYY
jgi:hypothetical protein